LAKLVSAVLVLSCGQIDRQTESQNVDDRVTTVGVSNECFNALDNDNFLCLFSFCMYCRHHRARDNWLNINPVQKEDYGEYLCTARNEHGTGEGVFVLEPSGFVF